MQTAEVSENEACIRPSTVEGLQSPSPWRAGQEHLQHMPGRWLQWARAGPAGRAQSGHDWSGWQHTTPVAAGPAGLQRQPPHAKQQREQHGQEA